MPTVDKHAPGAFCWAELSTSDQFAAKTFYSSLFSWTPDDMPLGPGDFYTIFKLDGRSSAAAYTIHPEEKAMGMPPHWNVYVATADADAAAHRAVLLGGKALSPAFDVFEAGRMAVLQDPTGAVFQVWQPNRTIGFEVIGQPGAFGAADLSTSDRARARKFYEDMFGWRMSAGAGKDDSGYLHIMNGDHYIGGILPDSFRNPNTPPNWMPYFMTASCDETTAKAKQMDAQVFVSPMNVDKTIRIAILADPQGAVFALYEAQKMEAQKGGGQ
jgi:predicted enzyme related to lactoylglutathione lyase